MCNVCGFVYVTGHYFLNLYRELQVIHDTDASHSKSVKPDHIKAFIKGKYLYML